MKYIELLEAKVPHDEEFLQILSGYIDESNAEYQHYLDSNGDVDDIEELADIINHNIDDDLPIEFHVNHEPRQDPTEWASAMADYNDREGEFVTVILHAKNLEGKWGPKTFKDLVIDMIKHETIHLGQYKRIPKEKFPQLKSGHQKGMDKIRAGGDESDWTRHYLADPHELMAYGNDLAGQIKRTEDPEDALRNPAKYMDELSVYKRYSGVFGKHSKELKQLLRYAASYM